MYTSTLEAKFLACLTPALFSMYMDVAHRAVFSTCIYDFRIETVGVPQFFFFYIYTLSMAKGNTKEKKNLLVLPCSQS